ncbi:MAG TPA: hypothetical protein VNZ86_13530 [Bacteroidia bacterium]|nr:hypothetical protein [Bacteroidia bacterium]
MSLSALIACIVLFVLNFWLVWKSKRKKRFGIYPGRICLLLIGLFLIFAILVYVTLHNTPPPVNSPIARKSISVEQYYASRAHYASDKLEDAQKLLYWSPVYGFLILLIKFQLILTFLSGLIALLRVSGRNKFYYLIIGISAWVGVLVFVLDKSIFGLVFHQ